MIGTNISSLRKQMGYTLSELSEKTGISKSYLSNIERNLKQNPSIHVMEKIAFVLKVDLRTLLQMAKEAERTEELEPEWLDFVVDLKNSGMAKDQIPAYKMLIEFMQWQHKKEKIK